LIGQTMDREHGRKGQPMGAHIHWHQRGRPIVQVQNLRRRRETARQFDRGFAEKNETRGIILVRLAVFAINSVAIEKLVASHKK